MRAWAGVVACQEALYPPPLGLLGLFDAPPQVGSRSAVHRLQAKGQFSYEF